MPDEVLGTMEDEIIRLYTEKLKEMIFCDTRIHNEDALYVIMNIDAAKLKYERMFK